jgi:RNA polymerase sigma-70 factor (ECF subfamily)
MSDEREPEVTINALGFARRVGAQSLPHDDRQAEQALVAKLKQGHPQFFEQFVRAHQDRVYDFCVRMLLDQEEAFDVTQDIFVSIHQNLDKFRADSKLSTWVYRIARNHCFNRLKYLKRRGRGKSDEFGESNEWSITEALGGSAQPDAEMTARSERELVHRAIRELDEEQRALVVLRDVEGLTYEEIMDITELAEGTVKSRLHRACEKLSIILTRLEAESSLEGE